MFGRVIENMKQFHQAGGYLGLVIGDKYSKGELVPLGFLCMQEVKKKGYKLKAIVVKNIGETKGKGKTINLWRHRALVGGFYIFKHEYVIIFQRRGE
jgi:hypothetical protein